MYAGILFLSVGILNHLLQGMSDLFTVMWWLLALIHVMKGAKKYRTVTLTQKRSMKGNISLVS